MKSQGLQELVKKIFGDETTKSQFIANPESVISRFALTEQERQAVLNTHAKLGLVTGNSQHLEATLTRGPEWFAPSM